MSVEITGIPQAMLSIMTVEKPSYNDGNTNISIV
jgi:hypothetical protein